MSPCATIIALVAGKITIVVVKILVSCKWIGRTALMEGSSNSATTWGLRKVHIVTSLTCVDTGVVRGVHSMGASAWSRITTT